MAGNTEDSAVQWWLRSVSCCVVRLNGWRLRSVVRSFERLVVTICLVLCRSFERCTRNRTEQRYIHTDWSSCRSFERCTRNRTEQRYIHTDWSSVRQSCMTAMGDTRAPKDPWNEQSGIGSVTLVSILEGERSRSNDDRGIRLTITRLTINVIVSNAFNDQRYREEFRSNASCVFSMDVS